MVFCGLLNNEEAPTLASCERRFVQYGYLHLTRH
jgi:hypothetical protein